MTDEEREWALSLARATPDLDRLFALFAERDKLTKACANWRQVAEDAIADHKDDRAAWKAERDSLKAEIERMDSEIAGESW
jgi:hypothetical protein